MTIQICLTPQQESRLRELAAAAGQDVDTYAREALAEKLDRPSLAELLAPIDKAMERSGMSDEDIDEMIERARDEVWRERQKGAP